MNYLEDSGLDPEELKSGGKPDESFSQLIKRAIQSSPRQRLFLTEIYTWIQDNYTYFKLIDPGWRNSVRHSLSTGKDFVRIKETKHRYNRGSEWCLADSNLGRWYLQLTEDDPTISQQQKQTKSEAEFSRLLQLSTLIPELSSSVMPQTPDRPVLINLSTCPDYLLGQVPHPELFVIKNRRTPSPSYSVTTNTTNTSSSVSSSSNIHFPLAAADSYLGSPLSRKATPKLFNVDMELEHEYLDFDE